MMKQSWQDYFKSAIQSAENLYSDNSTDVSYLLFCLRSKLISIQEYLEWAKENFQLPVLQEAYFQSHQPEAELYKKWQKVHAWSNEILPIAEWDGVLIIACLEIPEDYENGNPTAFVLAPYEMLEQTWAVYAKSEKKTAPMPIPGAASAAAPSDFADMTALAATVVAAPMTLSSRPDFFGDNGEIVLQDSSEENLEGEMPVEASAEAPEAPAGVEMSSQESESSPEGLFGDAPAPHIEALSSFTKTEPIHMGQIPPEDIPDDSTAPIAVPVAMKKGPRTIEPLLQNIGEKTRIDATPLPEDEMEEIPDHEVHFPDKKQISPVMGSATGDFPTAPVKPTMEQGPGTAFYLEKVRRQSVDHFDKEVLASFQQMKTFFKKSMLLAIGDKDQLVKPILWDGGFDIHQPPHVEFNLKTPSIFKIVNGTQKPYHGYVVVNDLNESFFESWNHGQIPDHVTLVPLMDGDHVIGMIMGFGEKASYNKTVLSYTENVAKTLSAKILRPPHARVA